MKLVNNILIIIVLCFSHVRTVAHANTDYPIDFWGETIHFNVKHPIHLPASLLYEESSISKIQELIIDAGGNEIANQIKEIVKRKELCNWLAYQLVRNAANQLIPKSTDYLGYTTAKWFLMANLGFDPLIVLSRERAMLYVKSSDIIYNTPYRTINGDQYVCLNYHDYGYASKQDADELIIRSTHASKNNFTFRITQLPLLEADKYVCQDLSFDYGNQKEHINIKVNSSVKNYFTNYPVTDYSNQFNIPLSTETKESLVRALKEKIKGLNTKDGVEYIMYFTRYAFLFEKDADIFGREKRLSPEETLLYGTSDCEDRSALFYALIKEIYNLPMLVLSYTDHVTVAVKLDKPIGKPIKYDNELYTICEPTPQREDLRLGEQLPDINNKTYEIAFSYKPQKLHQ